MVPLRTHSLLRDAGRTRALVTGWVCALVSVMFTALFGWLVYLVAWRNPRQYDVHDLGKGSTLAIFGVLLGIAGGFAIMAFRLVGRRRTRAGLLSPLALRVWGSLFAVGTALALVEAIVTKSWLAVPHFWVAATGAGSMALAAFALARGRERSASETWPRSRRSTPLESRRRQRCLLNNLNCPHKSPACPQR